MPHTRAYAHMRAGARACNDSISPPPRPRGYMIISATTATSTAMIAAMRAPTSQAGTTAGITIFRSVVSGSEMQHPRDVVLTRMHRRHTRGGMQHDRPRRGVGGEDDLGRGNGAEGQDRHRHQRDGRDGAQEVDAGHPISPDGGMKPMANPSAAPRVIATPRKTPRRRVCARDRRRVRRSARVQRAPPARPAVTAGIHSRAARQLRAPASRRLRRPAREPAERNGRPASHRRPAALRPEGAEPASSR